MTSLIRNRVRDRGLNGCRIDAVLILVTGSVVELLDDCLRGDQLRVRGVELPGQIRNVRARERELVEELHRHRTVALKLRRSVPEVLKERGDVARWTLILIAGIRERLHR